MDIDINSIESNFIKYIKNNIYLTEEQVKILNNNHINYTTCESMSELIFLIERNKNDNNYEELDWLSSNLSEFNYYHNVNK